jgi:hypothetical protein
MTLAGVRGIVHGFINTRRDELRFGTIGKGFAFGHWFLGNKGRCEWMVSNTEPPIKRPADPDHYKLTSVRIDKLLVNHPVDVLLFHDVISHAGHEAWNDESIQMLIWIGSRKIRKGTKFPEGWNISLTRLTHNAVGGVTDGVFRIGVAVRRKGKLKWKPSEETVMNTLRQVVDPTVGGRRTLPIFKLNHDLSNTARSIGQGGS